MKRYTVAALAGGLLFFYMGIVMYILLAILHINTLNNFEYSMAFEIIGFLLLTYFLMYSLFGKKIKAGFLVPLILFTVIYTVILDVINIVCVTNMSTVLFVLLNFVLLFIYGLISIPMYILGRR